MRPDGALDATEVFDSVTAKAFAASWTGLAGVDGSARDAPPRAKPSCAALSAPTIVVLSENGSARRTLSDARRSRAADVSPLSCRATARARSTATAAATVDGLFDAATEVETAGAAPCLDVSEAEAALLRADPLGSDWPASDDRAGGVLASVADVLVEDPSAGGVDGTTCADALWGPELEADEGAGADEPGRVVAAEDAVSDEAGVGGGWAADVVEAVPSKDVEPVIGADEPVEAGEPPADDVAGEDEPCDGPL